MISKEGAIRKFVRSYDIPVPEELVQEEFQLCLADMKHKMVYSQMAGQLSLNPLEQAQALQDSQEELLEVAYFTVKEDLVMKELLKEDRFSVTAQELQTYAQDLAKRQNTTMDMVRRFFGEDLSLLEGDARRKKAEDWIYQQVTQES